MENKVSKKQIVQIDIELWIPHNDDILFLDLKDFLFKEMIVKEDDFREKLENMDKSGFSDKYLVIYNSTKSIIPQWAYFLITTELKRNGAHIIYEKDNHREKIISHIISNRDFSEYNGKRLLIKGCGSENFSMTPYLALLERLAPISKAISYGEACSMVPVYRK